MKLIIFCCVIALIIFLVLRQINKLSSISPRIAEPFEMVHYNDINLFAPLKSFLSTNMYETCPQVSLNTNISLPSFIEQQASSLKCKLELSRQGILNYYINNKLVWNSSNPRKIIYGPDVTALLHYADTNEWKIVCTNNKLKLSVAPLAITRNGRTIWSFYSGWDSSEFSNRTTGEAFLLSDCRKFRMSLLENSDIVILKVNTDNKKFGLDLESSLVETYKNGHN
jgi:hypothetical protein